MADAGAAIQPLRVSKMTCPRCWSLAPMAPYAALTYRCLRCEWPFLLAAPSVPAPAVPSSGTPYTNASGSVMTVALSGGAVSAVSIGATAAGLAAPAAPVPTNTGGGGSVLAGVYQVQVTYVDANGESLPSASGSTTTTGSTSTLTVPSPAASGDATGWYAYVTQAGGSTYYRQQGSGSPTAIGTGLTLTAPPTTSGANPPTDNTTYGTVTVPAGGTITVTYSSAPTWTWALPTIGSGVSAGGTALPFASGGTAFAQGQVLIVDPSGTSDVVVVNGTPTGTSVPVDSLNSAHLSGVSVTVAVLTPALAGAGLENVPATAY
jgi:hypothetical protein